MTRPAAPRRAIALATGIFIAALALQSLAAPTTRTERRPEPTDHYAKGMEAVRAGDYPAALDHFTKADNAKPRDPDIINMLAYATRKNGKLDDARVLYLKALRLRPDFPECREYLGECYLELAWEQLEELKKSTHAQAPQSLGQLGESISAMAEALKSGKPVSLPERGW